MEEIIKALWQASDGLHPCRLTLSGEPLPRLVHPYGVCTTSTNKIVLVCTQVAGFTKAGGKAGYRNLKLARIEEVEILEEHFSKQSDFNPEDPQYKDCLLYTSDAADD